MNSTFGILSPVDWLALGWFLLSWTGYTIFARWQARLRPCLHNQLAEHRRHWVRQIVSHEMRITDATCLGILQRNVSFFASTTIFIIGGLLTVMGATERAIELVSALPMVSESSRALWEIKLLLLVTVYIYAFFKFTWSMRQYNFAVVLLGGAPFRPEIGEAEKPFIESASQVMTRANTSFNMGLRAYNFAMAGLAWFIHPWLFVLTSTLVVIVLYRREFHSGAMHALQLAAKGHRPESTKASL